MILCDKCGMPAQDNILELHARGFSRMLALCSTCGDIVLNEMEDTLKKSVANYQKMRLKQNEGKQ